ncbi:replication-relaxation family protein [Sphingomonas sp. AOB5]|uniref:replication-relaxation family protein n=1 Tax=Sphingomonas sp. AOB5 TaxID=3034017 RepID=UPI0023F8789E|nr:replication-relaxation family protein [Sphingomonas sp. AOB5]MDF7774271.1 replication-relaxation family protein [Sphingomonas sp. AOB5]
MRAHRESLCSIRSISLGYGAYRLRYAHRMSTDALSRRLRHAAPQPSDVRLLLTDADLRIFEAIDRHGPLPTHYLYELTRHLRSNLANLKYRLTHFYNGDANGPYLIRPPRQFAAFDARYQHLVYDLAPRARTLLAERGTLTRHPVRRTDPFLHQLMQACVGISCEITAGKCGLRYISRGEILTRSGATLTIPLPSADRTLTPDDLFGLEYPGHGFRFFAVEVDRSTESIERSNIGQTSYGRKVASYLSILRSGLYRTHWGIPNLTVLTVTTNGTHAANILSNIRRSETGQFAERFLFQAEPTFGVNWRVPRDVLSQLLTGEWMTVSATRSIGEA